MSASAIPDILAATAVSVRYVLTVAPVTVNVQTVTVAFVIQTGPERDVMCPHVQTFRNVTVR